LVKVGGYQIWILSEEFSGNYIDLIPLKGG
jgi:hypothetical protein